MTIPAGVTLRPATVEDAASGARLHIACWVEAYGPITDLRRIADHLADEDGWTGRWRRQIEDGSAPLLAVADAGPVGFLMAGPARADDAPAPWEVYALYVRAAWYGTGVGHALLDAVLGDHPAYLWVLEANARARAFYERHGFAPDGARKKYDSLDAWEIRMVRP